MRKIVVFVSLLLASVLAKAQTFTLVDSVPLGAYGAAAWGDYDGDGRKDLAYISQSMNIDSPDVFLVYHNTAAGFVRLPQPFMHLFNPAVCWADLNNDGKEDLVASGFGGGGNNKFQVYKSNGDGTFNLVNDTISGLSAGGIAIADYNNDGLKDIVATGFNDLGEIASFLLRADGDFHFTMIDAGLPGMAFSELKWNDYDHDGKQDLAMNGIGTSSRTYIYHNEGNDSFSLASPYMKGGAGTVDWLDYDGDGWFDLLTAGNDSAGIQTFTDLYHNNGNGTFTKMITNLPSFGEPAATDVADFNKDGKPDICFSGGNAMFMETMSALALGNGTFNFNLSAFKQTDIQNCIVAAADYDNDGNVDVIFSNYIYRNDGNGTGISSINSILENIKIYPNPSNNLIHIEITEKSMEVTIIDLAGRVLKTQTLHGGNNNIPVQNLCPGVYQLVFKTGKQTATKLFTKN